MRLLAKLSLVAMLASAPATARATDLLTVPVSSNDAVPVADAGFDWNGFYAGVYGVTQFSPVGGTQFGAGLDLGTNARFEFVLVGAEISVQGLVGGAGTTTSLQGVGKLGLAVTDDLIVYGAAGGAIDIGAAAGSDALLGAGAEMAVTDNVSVDARYLHGFAVSGANPKEQFTVGANFHF